MEVTTPKNKLCGINDRTTATKERGTGGPPKNKRGQNQDWYPSCDHQQTGNRTRPSRTNTGPFKNDGPVGENTSAITVPATKKTTRNMAFLEIIQKCNWGGTNTVWPETPPRKCAARTDWEDAEPSQNTTLKRYEMAFLQIAKSAIEEARTQSGPKHHRGSAPKVQSERTQRRRKNQKVLSIHMQRPKPKAARNRNICMSCGKTKWGKKNGLLNALPNADIPFENQKLTKPQSRSQRGQGQESQSKTRTSRT